MSLKSAGRSRFRTRFDTTPRVTLSCPDTPEDRRTKSEFAKDCDINLIMARYRKTGVLPESARLAAARYGDFDQIPDFMEMQDKIIAANDLFAALPAAVRRQFDNDPGQFLAASNSPEGIELMKKLGLGKPVDEQKPTQEAVSVPAGGQPAKASKNAPAGADEASKAKREGGSAPTSRESE